MVVAGEMAMGSFSFKTWYESNSDRLSKNRKHKYDNDPEYRAKVLAANQANREKKRAETAEERAAKKKAIRIAAAESPWRVVKRKSETLFTIGALAKVLWCSIQAIRLWERQGLIPKTRRRTKRNDDSSTGDRLYTAEMVETIKQILIKEGRIVDKSVKERQEIRTLIRTVRFEDGTIAQVPLFLIGALSKAVDRNVVTLEQLEARGSLPKTPFRTSAVGRRLYTAEMIEAVRNAFSVRGSEIRGEEAWKGFHDEIMAEWAKQGVIGAALVKTVPPTKDTANVVESSPRDAG